MKRLLIILTAAALLAFPAFASAKVPVGGKTRTEIIVAATGAHPAQFVCYDTYLAAKGSPWAIQTTPSADQFKRPCTQIQVGGFGILHYSAGRWNVVTEADEVMCPFLSRPHEPTIPGAILRELTGHYCSQLPKMPAPGSQGAQLQVRPYYFTTTGDGSGFYGGRTGHEITGGTSRPDLGRLDWTSYTATNAFATGISWAKFPQQGSTCDAEACEPFEIVGTVSLHAYRPEDGIFTRLQFSETYHGHRYSGTLDAIHSGFWYWTSPGDSVLAHASTLHSCRPTQLEREQNGVSTITTNTACRTAVALASASTAPRGIFRHDGQSWQLVVSRAGGFHWDFVSTGTRELQVIVRFKG